MALGAPGDVVSFTAESATQYGVVQSNDGTNNIIWYHFARVNGGQIVHTKEATSNNVTVLSPQRG